MLIYANGGPSMEANAHSGMYSQRDLIKSLYNIVTEGLPALAAAEVIHMDIKADNLVMPEKTDAKLIDFGNSSTFKDGALPSSLVFKSLEPRFPPEIYLLRTGTPRPELKRHKVRRFVSGEVEEHFPMIESKIRLGKFGREFYNLRTLSQKTLKAIYGLLFIDTFDLYSLSWMVADFLSNPGYKFKPTDTFTQDEYNKLVIWLRNTLADNAFNRWGNLESAEYWPVIWDGTVKYATAERLEVSLSNNARERMTKAIRTKVFDGELPDEYNPVNLYRTLSHATDSAAFRGAQAYATGGKKTLVRKTRRSRSKTRRRSSSRRSSSYRKIRK